MKIIRFETTDGSTHYGVPNDDFTSAQLIEGDLYGEYSVSQEEAEVTNLLAPVEPTQILCIGLNYKQHAAETKANIPENPILFVKGINTLQHPGAPIEIPKAMESTRVDYECELAVIIGKPAKNVKKENALDYVLGYTACNDVSARDWQIKWGGGQWCRGKFFDTFCPLGPALVTTDEITNPNELAIKTEINGETLQDWNTNDMIFDVPTLIEFLSGSTTLVPGTVILTGTPHGVGMAADPPRWLQPGDSASIMIEKIGTLTNPVIDEPVA